MADVIKMATRDAYGKALVEAGKTNEDFIVLDADLAAATKTGMFKKEFPERFYDCGIAESNMISIAAGVAATGKRVFASSFAFSIAPGIPLLPSVSTNSAPYPFNRFLRSTLMASGSVNITLYPFSANSSISFNIF